MTDCESICYGSIQEKTHGVSNLIFPINLAIKLVIVETQPFIENFPIKTTHTVWYFPLQSLITCFRQCANPADGDGICPGAPQLEPPRTPNAKDPEAGSDWQWTIMTIPMFNVREDNDPFMVHKS